MQIKTMMMTRMMISIKKVAISLFVVDIALISYSLYQGNNWLVSSQSAFTSSLLVTLGSFLGYKKMVEKRLEVGDIPKEDRDELDILDDEHDLYSDVKDLKTVIEEERAKIGGLKNTATTLGKSVSGAVSLFRLGGYAVLFLSFLYLNRHGILNIAGFLTGLAVVPLVAFLSIFLKDK